MEWSAIVCSMCVCVCVVAGKLVRELKQNHAANEGAHSRIRKQFEGALKYKYNLIVRCEFGWFGLVWCKRIGNQFRHHTKSRGREEKKHKQQTCGWRRWRQMSREARARDWTSDSDRLTSGLAKQKAKENLNGIFYTRMHCILFLYCCCSSSLCFRAVNVIWVLALRVCCQSYPSSIASKT